MEETVQEDSGDGLSVGWRIRSLRIGNGMSQAQLAAAAGLSASYVSLIEADRRAPGGEVLQRLSRSLRVASEELLGGKAADPAVVAATLSQAQSDVEAGRPRRALRSLGLLLRRYDGSLRWELECRVRLISGYARYRSGDVPGGLTELEELLGQAAIPRDMLISLLRTLAACYLDGGDLARAVELAQRGMELCDLSQILGADGHPPSVQRALGSDFIGLGVTLASAYRERGDMLSADAVSRKMLDLVEQGRSAQLRGEVYRAASLNAEASGETRRAVALAARAIGAVEESGADYLRARMQVAFARMLLNLAPAHAERAEQLLVAAEGVLREAGSAAELMQCRLQLARVKLATDRLEQAIEIAKEVADSSEAAELDGVRALTVVAQAQLRAGDRHASDVLHQAQQKLAAASPSRPIAQAWRELGDVYAEAGSAGSAIEAYECALSMTGICRLAGTG